MKKSRSNFFVTLLLVTCMLLFVFVSVCTGADQQSAENKPTETKDSFVVGMSLRWVGHPYLKSIIAGATDTFKDLEKEYGISIEIKQTSGNDLDAQQQIRDMEDLATQNVDAILIFPGDSRLIVQPVENIFMANNKPVIIMDVGIESNQYTSWVCPDFYVGGKMGGEAAGKFLPQGAKVIVYNHMPGNLNCADRCQGFIDGAKEAGLAPTNERILINGQTPDAAKAGLEDALTADPELSGVFVGTNTGVTGFISAIEERGRADDFKIICFDLDWPTLELVKAGKIAASVVNDPYQIGVDSAKQCMYALLGMEVQKRVIPATRVLTIENYQDFENDPQVTLTKE